VPIAYSEVKTEHASPKLIERGADYEVWNNYDGTFTWKSAPQWVLSSGLYVPYVYKRDDSKKCYLIQTGRISGEIYDSGVGIFYDVNMTEQRVKSEVWEVWDAIGNKKVTLNTPITFKVAQNSSGVFVNATRTTSKPNGVLTILYCFQVGAGLKHYVYWRNNEASSQTIRVKQVWDLAEYLTKCQVDGAETTVSAAYNGSKYTFYDVASTRHVFEDQSAMLKKLESTNIDFAGKKATFAFSGWTLKNNEYLTIDPTTVTQTPSSMGEIVKSGTNYTTVHNSATGSTYTELPALDYSQIGQVFDDPDYGIYRTVIDFDTAFIPDNATPTSAKVMLYGAYDYSDTDFYIRIQNWTEPEGISTADYDAFDGVNYDNGLFNTASWTLGAYNNVTLTNFDVIDLQGDTDIMVRSSRDVNSNSSTGSEYISFYAWIDGSKKPTLEVTYTEENEAPTIGEFQAPTLVLGDEYFFLNCSVDDGNGYLELVNATIQISGNVILKWVTSATFSELGDPSGYCTLDASGSIKTNVNSTAYTLSWKIKLTSSYPYTYVDVISANSKVFDNAGASGTNSKSNLFFFENRPTIGEFGAPSTVYAHQYVYVNATVNDAEGKTTLANATIELSGSVILKWLNTSNTFSIESDPSEYCTLNATACLRTSLNTTAYLLSWNLKFAWNYSYATLSIIEINTEVYDLYACGTNSLSDLSIFEDELFVASASVDPTETPPQTNVVFSGTICYENTTTPPYDLDGITVNIELSGVLQGYTSTILSDGAWSKTVRVPSSIGNKTYVVYVMTDEMGVENKSLAFFVMSSGPPGGGGQYFPSEPTYRPENYTYTPPTYMLEEVAVPTGLEGLGLYLLIIAVVGATVLGVVASVVKPSRPTLASKIHVKRATNSDYQKRLRRPKRKVKRH
jgi:hypothetical protein